MKNVSSSPRLGVAPSPRPSAPADRWLEVVAREVRGLRFGTVQVVVHDSRVVQVESQERHRFDARHSS